MVDSFLVALHMNCHFPKMTIVSTMNFTTSLMLFWGVGLETINEDHWSWKEIIKMVWNLLCCSVEIILIVKYMFFRFADWLGRSIYFWRCKILYKVSLFNYDFFSLGNSDVVINLWLYVGVQSWFLKVYHILLILCFMSVGIWGKRQHSVFLCYLPGHSLI